eukprot:4005090-Alexandrium_andersonii.AAC.1
MCIRDSNGPDAPVSEARNRRMPETTRPQHRGRRAKCGASGPPALMRGGCETLVNSESRRVGRVDFGTRELTN